MKFQESTTILNAHTKKSLETYRMHRVYSFLDRHQSAWVIKWNEKYATVLKPLTLANNSTNKIILLRLY